MALYARRLCALLLALALSGCAAAPRQRSLTVGTHVATVETRGNYALLEGYAMDTVLRLEYWGKDAEEAAEAAFAKVVELERLLSVTDPGSEVARANAAGGERKALSVQTDELIGLSLAAWRETDGAFDPALLPLKEVWGWLDTPHVPGDAEIAEALTRCGADKITLEDGRLTLADGAAIDLGGIAKGYAASLLAQMAREADVSAALINLGGNVQTYGRKADGSPWNIGIRAPDGSSDLLGVVSVSGTDCVVTSGAYERSFTEDGVTYGHVLNGRTGYPADTELLSVSITGTDAARADALSTALFVMGLDGAKAFWREKQDFGMILMDREGTVYISGNLASAFRTDCPVQTIER